LIRPHATEQNDTLLSAQSRVRAIVEKTREDVLRWLRRRWMGVRQEAGFNAVATWALKEISDGQQSNINIALRLAVYDEFL